MKKEIVFKTWKDLIKQCPPKIKEQIERVAEEECEDLASYWPYRDGRWSIIKNVYYDALKKDTPTKNLVEVLQEGIEKLGHKIFYITENDIGVLLIGGQNADN